MHSAHLASVGRRAPRRPARRLPVLLGLALAGCVGTSAPATPGASFAPRAETRAGAPPTSRALVVRREQLAGNDLLLGALTGRVAGMQVRQAGACPEITLRGPMRLQGASEPRIYVNGSPAANTCILQQMRADDVERVEIYPSGVSGRAGYLNHPNGLILVFLRQS